MPSIERVLEHLRGREVWVRDAFGGTDPAHRLPIRIVCERAYHALFAHQLFVSPTPEELAGHRPEFTIIAAPDFQAVPERDGTRSEVFIILELRAEARSDRGHAVRGRNQEVRLLDPQLPAAAERRAVDALLGQRGRRRRRCALLRPVGHGQDDPLGRSRCGP